MKKDRVVKRVFDLLFCFLGIGVFFFPFILLCFAVYFILGSPIFFKQTRPGLNGKPFTIYKFRTMTNGSNGEEKIFDDSDRLTSFGKILRKTSLDELPELWNVLKGEMSLVGPRPLLMEYLQYYTPEQAHRHDAIPGITGWAQVNGRNEVSWEQKFKMDTWYVDHQSCWLDLKILLSTVVKVVQGRGVNAKAHVTMPKFTGKVGRDL